MRRLALLGAVVAAVVAAVVLATGGGARASSTYRVDVLFDNSRGLVPGQLVESAGARIGKIKAVTLSKDFKARVQLEVKGDFAPFHRDAQCLIRPQGLIAEYYVQCDPGTPAAPPLKGADGHAPTLGVDRTAQPVSLTDLFEVASVPVRDRLTVLLSELGIATAGRGDDINDLIRRANPTLRLARRVIAVLKAQRHDLADTLDQADDVLAGLAHEPGQVRQLIGQAARTTQITAAKQNQLRASLQRLPALLGEAQPSLDALDRVVKTGVPLARDLRAAAPQVDRFSRDIGPLARAVRPTLRQSGPVLEQGTGTVRRAAPVTRLVRGYLQRSLPNAQTTAKLLTNLQDKKVPESLLTLIYNLSAATSRYDSISHILPAFLLVNKCAAPASTPVGGCGPDQDASNRLDPDATRPATSELLRYLLK